MQPLMKEWKEKADFEWIIVTGDDPQVMKSFVKDKGISATVLMDTEYSLFKLYRVQYTPTEDLINADGSIFDRVVGWDKKKGPAQIEDWLMGSAK